MEEEKTEEKKEKKEGEEKKEDESESGGWKVWVAIIVIVVAIGAAYFINSGGGGVTGEVISGITKSIPGIGAKEVGVIKLGFMGPLSGEAASFGNSIKKGVDLAMMDSDIVNLEIVYEDSLCEGQGAVTSINKLISADKVVAVIGEVCSGATIPAAPIAEQNSVVLISAASTSPEISNLGSYIFRTVPSDTLQGAFAAENIYNRGHYKLAIMYSQEDYGEGLRTVLTDEFEKLGGEVVASEAFERGTTDLRTQITKIKNAKPDSIYFISNSPDAVVAGLRQLKELGVRVLVFGSEGLKGPDTLEAGSAAEGLTVTSVSIGTEWFAEEYRNEYNEEPGPFSAQGYDAFLAIAKTIEGGALTGTEIRDALNNLEFEGASGYIDFDSNGDVTGSYDIYIVHNGDFVLAN